MSMKRTSVAKGHSPLSRPDPETRRQDPEQDIDIELPDSPAALPSKAGRALLRFVLEMSRPPCDSQRPGVDEPGTSPRAVGFRRIAWPRTWRTRNHTTRKADETHTLWEIRTVGGGDDHAV